MKLIRRILFVIFLLLAIRYRAYLLDTESHLLYGLTPVFFVSLFLFEKPQRGFRLSDGLLLGFLLTMLPSFFLAQHPFGFFELTTFFVGALIYFSVRFLPLPKLPYRHIFVALGAMFSVYGLFHFSLSSPDRLSSIFHGRELYTYYPNAAALFLLSVLPFNLELSFTEKRFWQGLLFLNTSAFLLTFSRGAYSVALFALVLSGLIFWREFFKKQALKKLGTLFLTGILSVGFALGLNFLKTDGVVVSERLLLKDDAGMSSVNERVAFWEGALQMSLDHPWFGVSPGGFSAFYPSYQKEWLATSDHPHNVLLKILSESGFPAAILFGAFLMVLFLPVVFGFRKKIAVSDRVLFLAVLVFLLHNLIDYNLNFPLLSALFFVLLANLQNIQEQKNEKAAAPFWIFILFTMMSTCLVFVTAWEGAGLVQARHMERAFELDPRNGELRQYLSNPPQLPFEMSHFDLEGTLSLKTGQAQALQAFLDRHQGFSEYSGWLYFKTYLDLNFASQLIDSNPYNELEYYYLYYLTQDLNEEKTAQIADLIREYTQLLSTNAHMTVLSENPKYAKKLCELSPEVLSEPCLYFDWIWRLEAYKFNQRYDTELLAE